ncbi:hypothetical protein [Actinomadura litoris]|uniref:Uncharacterized protein n=1 Tax=Actinomadura litoris TaxID=2678616 RepID=A0A7K1LB37_9ACTN|nr:hypothetical protein [Actinomadura litoris]MUN41632.1 hypothetical protein [Actinomadura litoris]
MAADRLAYPVVQPGQLVVGLQSGAGFQCARTEPVRLCRERWSTPARAARNWVAVLMCAAVPGVLMAKALPCCRAKACCMWVMSVL